jgi:hypothetical protein
MCASKTIVLLLTAIAAATAGLSPARGQCRLCDTPTMALSQSSSGDPIQVEIETSLDFDRLIVAGSGQGAAVIRPDGSSSAEGALVQVSPRAMVGTATVHGVAGRTVRVELPRNIQLYSVNGGRIVLDDLASDLPSLPRLDPAGNLTFRFGGRVTVTGDSQGDYRGDMPITVEYQ